MKKKCTVIMLPNHQEENLKLTDNNEVIISMVLREAINQALGKE